MEENKLLLSCCNNPCAGLGLTYASIVLGRSFKACEKQFEFLQPSTCVLPSTCEEEHLLLLGWKSKEVFTISGEMLVKIGMICSAHLEVEETVRHLREKKVVSISLREMSDADYQIIQVSAYEILGRHQLDDSHQVMKKGRPAAGTLIVCPSSLMKQWHDELHKKVNPQINLSVLIYHGSSRRSDPHELVKYDVIITSYGLVTADRSVNWHGLELFSMKRKQLRIIEAKMQWHAMAYMPSGGGAYLALRSRTQLMTSTATSGTTLGGESIISLPPKSIELRKLEFSKEERDFYSKLEWDVKEKYKEYTKDGMVKRNYREILSMLQCLRQAIWLL